MTAGPAGSLLRRLAWFALLYAGGVTAVALVAACFHFLIARVPR